MTDGLEEELAKLRAENKALEEEDRLREAIKKERDKKKRRSGIFKAVKKVSEVVSKI